MAASEKNIDGQIYVKKRDGFPWNILRGLYRSIFAIGLLFTISLVLFTISAVRILNAESKPLPDKMVLSYTFKSGLEEVVSSPSLTQPLLRPGATLNEVVTALTAAAKDDRVKGFVAKIEDMKFSVAQVQELRNAVVNFRKSGKFAEIYADSYGASTGGLSDYYLATAFDKVWLQPIGVVAINGVAAEVPFFRGFLDKVGVEPQFGHRGTYKSAVESITLTDMSAPAKEAMSSLLSDLSTQIIAGIAADRKLTVDEVRADIDAAPFTDDAALKAKLVDRLGYYDEIIGEAKARAGTVKEKTVDLLDYSDDVDEKKNGSAFHQMMVKAEKEKAAKDGTPPVKNKIALIIAAGEIAQFGGTHAAIGESGIQADKVARAFRQVQDDPEVAAVVFRIDSPGGSPEASETIRRAMMKTREGGIPVIVSMGGYAASGGYWVATGADKIVAQPATITGSIGVFGGKFVVRGLMDKLGVNAVTISEGAHAGMWSSIQNFSPEEMARFEGTLDNIYQAFIKRVMDGRHMTHDEVEAIAEGRVWSGEQAKDRKLVDELGGLDRAVEVARETAKLDPKADIPLVEYPARKTTLEMFADIAINGGTLAPKIEINAADIIASLQQSAKSEGALLKAPALDIH
ncbi:MAG: signal peptide peptidase SppA [Micavibrio sp.]|nr:signal peptide peptidase SppA [Micavibrio sp.]